MNWILFLFWLWSFGAAVGIIPVEETGVRRFAILVTLVVPVVAFFASV